MGGAEVGGAELEAGVDAVEVAVVEGAGVAAAEAAALGAGKGSSEDVGIANEALEVVGLESEAEEAAVESEVVVVAAPDSLEADAAAAAAEDAEGRGSTIFWAISMARCKCLVASECRPRSDSRHASSLRVSASKSGE
jgi:hypothetical protein